MTAPRIWLNKHLSNTWEVIALLRAARQSGEFRVVCSHPRPEYADRLDCDGFEQEPIGLSDDDYVRYCVDFAERNRVDVFIPGRKALPIVRAAARFEAMGTRILAAADAETLTTMQSKSRAYAALRHADIRLPAFDVANDLAEFDAACARIGSEHPIVCYKPDESVYGIGFHVLADEHARIEHARPWRDTPERARGRLDRASGMKRQIVMQYLPGPERSVDCLARHGELIRCVVRRKMGDGQRLEDHAEIAGFVRRLTAKLNLHNLFNVQFRDDGGQPYLLEINPRMSGGLPFACESGVNFLLWAIRLALGTATPEDIPLPRFGVWVPQPEPVGSL